MTWNTTGAIFGRVLRTGWDWLTAPFGRRTIGIALANQPRLLGDILRRQLEREADFKVVSVSSGPAKFWQRISPDRVDWVVMMSSGALSDSALLAAHLFNGKPASVLLSRDVQSATVITPAADGQSQRQIVSDLTVDKLFAIMRRQSAQDG